MITSCFLLCIIRSTSKLTFSEIIVISNSKFSIARYAVSALYPHDVLLFCLMNDEYACILDGMLISRVR